MTEKEIYNWFAEDDRFVQIDKVYNAFPNESRSSIKRMLDSLCAKGKFYKVSTAFGDMYGIDSTVEDEPVTINTSTGSGMGDYLRASGALDGYEPVSKKLIKECPPSSLGIKKINAAVFKKDSYSSDDIVNWMNTIEQNRLYLTNAKQHAIQNVAQSLQAMGLTGDKLLAYIEGLSKIEMEVIAKERTKQYKQMSEIWDLIKENSSNQTLLQSVSKELSENVVAKVEDMTINGGQLYYSVPIPDSAYYKSLFKIKKSAENKKKADSKPQIELDKDQIREVLSKSSKPLTATEISSKTDLSASRVSELLAEMKEDNEVIREVKNRKAYFTLM